MTIDNRPSIPDAKAASTDVEKDSMFAAPFLEKAVFE
jgi:hypothetical protein